MYKQCYIYHISVVYYLFDGTWNPEIFITYRKDID